MSGKTVWTGGSISPVVNLNFYDDLFAQEQTWEAPIEGLNDAWKDLYLDIFHSLYKRASRLKHQSLVPASRQGSHSIMRWLYGLDQFHTLHEEVYLYLPESIEATNIIFQAIWDLDDMQDMMENQGEGQQDQQGEGDQDQQGEGQQGGQGQDGQDGQGGQGQDGQGNGEGQQGGQGEAQDGQGKSQAAQGQQSEGEGDEASHGTSGGTEDGTPRTGLLKELEDAHDEIMDEFASVYTEEVLKKTIETASDRMAEDMSYYKNIFGDDYEAARGQIDTATFPRSQRLEAIFDYVGRYMRITPQRRQAEVETEEPTDILYTDEIEKIFPSELAMMRDDNGVLGILKLMEYLDGGLPAWDKKQYLDEGGDMIFVMDDSSSMGWSDQDIRARALVWSMSKLVEAQGRRATYIAFSNRGHTRTIDSNASLRARLEWLDMASGGGTDFVTPLNKAMNVIETSKDLRNPDILWVSDGEPNYDGRIQGKVLRRYEKLKEETGTRFFAAMTEPSFQFGDSDSTGLTQVADQYMKVGGGDEGYNQLAAEMGAWVTVKR